MGGKNVEATTHGEIKDRNPRAQYSLHHKREHSHLISQRREGGAHPVQFQGFDVLCEPFLVRAYPVLLPDMSKRTRSAIP